ncbi:MAG: 2OG-Fe(II) oxygenase [Myxococcales bacterium]|nr:2OG-Fe(II) oxygenase [Myxococcales bacterium]
MYAGHLDLSVPLWWTVARALCDAACEAYLARFRRGDAELAPIIRADGVGLDLALRNNTRIMWDDADEANHLLDQTASRMAEDGARFPERFQGGALAGANPRLRIYRYGPGERHSAHWDTEHALASGALTRLTLVVYLNDDFVGGETDFPELGVRVTPARGMALVFQQRVLHQACPVTEGAKFVLRTDVAYDASARRG